MAFDITCDYVCLLLHISLFLHSMPYISVCKCVEEDQSDVKSRADASKELDILPAKVCVTFCCAFSLDCIVWLLLLSVP